MADPAEAGPKVLVVDDDRLVLHSTRLVLESEGFRVVVVDRGAAALDAARAEQPDVLLLDVMMPEVDGWEILRRLRASPDTAAIPVVIFTAREHPRGRRLAREMGAVDYVQKPFEAASLVALLRTHAGARRGA